VAAGAAACAAGSAAVAGADAVVVESAGFSSLGEHAASAIAAIAMVMVNEKERIAGLREDSRGGIIANPIKACWP
jgi:hypothetical protein